VVIASDIMLYGAEWPIAIEAFDKFFTQRIRYDLFLLATAIGVVYDKRCDIRPDDESENTPPSVPRNVFNSNSAPFDELFTTAILTTSTVDLSDERRLQLAFGEDDKQFDKRSFLQSYANFGIKKLIELIGDDELETADNLKRFLILTVDGSNLDLNPLALEPELFVDEEDLEY